MGGGAHPFPLGKCMFCGRGKILGILWKKIIFVCMKKKKKEIFCLLCPLRPRGWGVGGGAKGLNGLVRFRPLRMMKSFFGRVP